MATYLDSFEIDWGWQRLTKAQRAVARRHEARFQADPHRHTLQTFTEALADASRQLKGRAVRALVADFEGEYELLARDGDCDEAHERSFDSAGTCPDVLTAKDFRAAGVETVALSLTWPEQTLHALQEQAFRLDRTLSWLVQRAWALAGKKKPNGVRSALPSGGEKRRQSVVLPLKAWAELTGLAEKERVGVAVVAQRAVAMAWPAISALERGPRAAKKPSGKTTRRRATTKRAG